MLCGTCGGLSRKLATVSVSASTSPAGTRPGGKTSESISPTPPWSNPATGTPSRSDSSTVRPNDSGFDDVETTRADLATISRTSSRGPSNVTRCVETGGEISQCGNAPWPTASHDQAMRIRVRCIQPCEHLDERHVALQAGDAAGEYDQTFSRHRGMIAHPLCVPISIGNVTVGEFVGIDAAWNDSYPVSRASRVCTRNIVSDRTRDRYDAFPMRHDLAVARHRIQTVNSGNESWSHCGRHSTPSEPADPRGHARTGVNDVDPLGNAPAPLSLATSRRVSGDFAPIFQLMCSLPSRTSRSTSRPPSEMTIERCPAATIARAISSVPRSTPPTSSAGSSCAIASRVMSACVPPTVNLRLVRGLRDSFAANELEPVQSRVQTAASEQLRMGPGVCDASSVHHDDPVGAFDG